MTVFAPDGDTARNDDFVGTGEILPLARLVIEGVGDRDLFDETP